jgi:7,8-dihydropterin-6-yl-methyl-4-(beta-D-ribofuranosyl)aminobenzene 5'-phosphate synthase
MIPGPSSQVTDMAVVATDTPTAAPEVTASPDSTVGKASSGPTGEPTPGLTVSSKGGLGPVTITVVYDNNAHDPRLQTAWGFACLIEREEATILFDTGGDDALLLSNMDILGFDPSQVDVVVLSHIHGDHVGGLSGLLDAGAHPKVYLPRSFPAAFKSQVQARAELVEVDGSMELVEGVYTTGEMGSSIIEQALVLTTTRGLVVITGCAHPGIVEIVRRAKEVGGDDVYLVLGGFHLGGASQERIEAIIAAFREMGVQKVAPCHCTGDQAIGLFREAYGQDFVQAGVGRVVKIGP